MADLTAAQRAGEEAEQKQAVGLVKLGLPTPLTYCTGQDPFLHTDSLLYTPRPMNLGAKIVTDEPLKSRWTIDLSDPDRELFDSWYDDHDDWANIAVGVYAYLRYPSVGWTQVLTMAWFLTSVQHSDRRRMMRLLVSASVGLRPRAPSVRGDRSTFPWAPDPRKPIQIGDASYQRVSAGHRGPPPEPGGHRPFWNGNLVAPQQPVKPFEDPSGLLGLIPSPAEAF